ncbi:MAG: nucleotide exchange factor GrpE [Firmicutes bacterium]|jgi:molecular chaperone GrpE (heat shock protein)|nr:nucleotide exchange factor GrpE [Bacillota bacterium]
MIDFEKELSKFDFFAVNDELNAYHNETTLALDAVTAVLKRIGKEINNTNIQLEEILSQHEEDEEKNEQIKELKKALAVAEEEKLSLIKGLVTTLDKLEDIYRYALKNEDAGWSAQMELLWKSISADLLPLGLVRIEGENTFFDARLHAAVQVKEDVSKPNGIILEILRCGYVYRSTLLRKAQVMVNKTSGGTEKN